MTNNAEHVRVLEKMRDDWMVDDCAFLHERAALTAAIAALKGQDARAAVEASSQDLGSLRGAERLAEYRRRQQPKTEAVENGRCVCGQWTLGTVHRADRPCYQPESGGQGEAMPSIELAAAIEWTSHRIREVATASPQYGLLVEHLKSLLSEQLRRAALSQGGKP